MRHAILLLAGVGLGMAGSLLVHGQPPPRPESKSAAAQPKALEESRDSLCDIPADLIEPRFLDPEQHEAEKRWRLMSRQRVSVEFKEATMEEVMKILSEKSGFQFEIDKWKLTDEGVELDKLRFTLVAKNWQIKTVIKKLLQPHQLTIVLGDYDDYSENIIKITTAVCWSEKLTTKIYPVADLVSYRRDDQVHLTREDFEERIQGVVSPESWDSVGGEGGLLFDRVSLSLTVRQISGPHQELEDYLTTLRKVRCRVPSLPKATGSPSLEEIRKAQDSFARAQSELTRLENELRGLENTDLNSPNTGNGFGGGWGGGFENVTETQNFPQSVPKSVLAAGQFVGVDQFVGVGDHLSPDPYSDVAQRARRVAVRAIELAQRMDKLRVEKLRERENERRKASEKSSIKPESPKGPPSTESKP